MKESEFIVSRLQKLHIKCKYAYEKESEFHIIEIYERNKEIERSLWKEFMSKFPDSDLLISEPCRENNMSNLIYINI